jgi:hypothetical protein
MTPKFEAFALKYNLNARGRKALKLVSHLWDLVLAAILLGAVWLSVVFSWAAWGV